MPTPVAWSKQAARTRALVSFAGPLPALALLVVVAEALPLVYTCCVFTCRDIGRLPKPVAILPKESTSSL